MVENIVLACLLCLFIMYIILYNLLYHELGCNLKVLLIQSY